MGDPKLPNDDDEESDDDVSSILDKKDIIS